MPDDTIAAIIDRRHKREDRFAGRAKPVNEERFSGTAKGEFVHFPDSGNVPRLFFTNGNHWPVFNE